MNSRGIVPVLLKGAAYLKTGVYEDPAARILSDLDLLVEEARVSEAVGCVAFCRVLRALCRMEPPT